MYKLVLVRHGQSTWNLENRFTGWTGVGLTDLGRTEALEAGKLLKEGGYVFDVAYTSVCVSTRPAMSQPEIALSPADLAALVELAPEPAEAGRAQRRLGRICRPVANAPRLPVQG